MKDSDMDKPDFLIHPPYVSRRRFISALSAATAGVLAGACGKEDNPAGPTKPKEYPEGASRVATARLTTYDYNTLKTELEKCFDLIGGLADIIPSGGTVGMKINCTGGDGSANGYQRDTGLPVGETYWTHPTVVKAVGELVLDAGAGKLYIVEAIYDWESINDFGYKQVIDELGAEFVDLNKTSPYSGYANRPVKNKIIYSSLTQNGILNDFDCFISLPKAKRHKGGGVTHGMKNLVGTLPVPCGKYNNGAGHRAGIHQHRTIDGNTTSNLRRVILDLNNATPINLVVNDAIHTVLGSEGPWNRGEWALRPVNFNRLIVGKDPVAVDSISTKVIGYDPMDNDNEGTWGPSKDGNIPGGINYLKQAHELGMGNYDPEMIEVLGYGI